MHAFLWWALLVFSAINTAIFSMASVDNAMLRNRDYALVATVLADAFLAIFLLSALKLGA